MIRRPPRATRTNTLFTVTTRFRSEGVGRMLGAFAVTIWLVRHLGPGDFGILSYAISISMIAEVTAGLGVAVIVVRELVESPEDEAELLGSAFVLRFQIGRASCRERMCPYVSISAVAASLTTKATQTTCREPSCKIETKTC